MVNVTLGNNHTVKRGFHASCIQEYVGYFVHRIGSLVNENFSNNAWEQSKVDMTGKNQR
jgi:hypothetical protein